ncbi:MAG: Gx transporter family protein [Spirochaetota bacterium]|jgi:heptaprenyl diphosphate synthase|nr:Gx transporter family protein [Spirochaetota bacterium]
MLLKRLAVFTAIASCLSLAERAIPLLPPWFKPGLANCVTLYLAARGEYRLAFLVTVARGFAAALVFGGLFSPAHIFSLAGGLASVLVCIALCRFLSGCLSFYGVSVASAIMHAAAQLCMAALLFLSREAVLGIAPFMFAASVLTGLLSAAVARRIYIQAE